MNRSVDLLFFWLLLDWPRISLAIHEARIGQIRRLAATFNSYPPLIVAFCLLAAPRGSFALTTLTQVPAPSTPLILQVCHWLGALLLLIALPALLGLAPFTSPTPLERFARLGMRMRAIGILALAIMPYTALIPEDLPWLLPIPVLSIALLTWLLSRLGMRRSRRAWATWLWRLSVVGMIVLAAAGFVRG
jgi:formate hydrogenlyase subunit 4